MATGTWDNADGLRIKYGTTEADLEKAGIYPMAGPWNMVEVTLDYTDLTTTSAILSDTLKLPKNARIVKVEVETETAWDSAADNFVLNLGLIREDRTTAYDVDGLIAALPQASMDPAGEIVTLTNPDTYAGDLIGTTLEYTGWIVGDYDTGAPTAGKSKIRIFYRPVA